MAVLQLENGKIYKEIGAIANKLAALNVQIDYLAIDKTAAIQELLVKDLLNVTEKQQILAAFNSEFELFKITGGCQSNTEHWFYLTPSLYLKAVQYYTTAQGWVPQYTKRHLKIKN